MTEKGLRFAILPLAMGHFNISSDKISKKKKKKRKDFQAWWAWIINGAFIFVFKFFNVIITSGYIEDMKNTREIAQEKLNLQVLIHISIFFNLSRFNEAQYLSRSIKQRDFRI